MATAPKKAAPPVKAAPAKVAPKVAAKTNGAATNTEDMGERIAVKLADDDTVLSVPYTIGADLDALTENFGADAVFAKAKVGIVLEAQAKLRRILTLALKGDKDGKKTPLPKDTSTLLDDWKPSAGGSRARTSPSEKVATLVGKLSQEERAALIARLKAGE